MDRAGIARPSRRYASWDGHSLAFGGEIPAGEDAAPYLTLGDVPDEDGVPLLDEEHHSIPVSVLLWPIEQLISRPFSLPLAQPRLLDTEILTQELSEQAGDTAADSWLAWHAGKGGAGVEGIVFGLPMRTKKTLASQAGWQDCAVIAPDAWVRLSAWPETPDAEASCVAVLDEDKEGLFVGVRTPDAWRGMRRINRTSWKSDGALIEDALRSLQAMGWKPETDGATGRLSGGLLRLLTPQVLQWQGREEDDARLPDRHQANLEAAAGQAQIELNFRHGAWRKRNDPGSSLRPWRHTLVLLGVVALIMLAGGLWRMISLQRQADAYRSEIVSAFHRGLPDQTVMLDPLAQLRMAARGSTAGPASDNFLRQLAAVARARKAVAGWSIREIDYDNDGMRLFGMANDFAMVNRIRDALVAGGAGDVQIEDTQAQDKQVGFRLRWSQ